MSWIRRQAVGRFCRLGAPQWGTAAVVHLPPRGERGVRRSGRVAAQVRMRALGHIALAALVVLVCRVGSERAWAGGEEMDERNWIYVCHEAVRSKFSSVRDGAVAALARVGPDVLDVLILDLKEPRDALALEWLEPICLALGSQEARMRLEALRGDWPAGREGHIRLLWSRLKEHESLRERSTLQGAFPGVVAVLDTFTKDDTYVSGDPRVHRIINQGPQEAVIEALFSALRGSAGSIARPRVRAAADALSSLMYPSKSYEEQVAELLRAGCTIVARALRPLPASERYRNMLLDAVELGFMDAEVLEGLERYGSDAAVGQRLAAWLGGASGARLDVAVEVSDFLLRHGHAWALMNIQEYEKRMETHPESWRLTVLRSNRGDRAALDKLVATLQEPIVREADFYRQVGTILNAAASSELFERGPYHLEGDAQTRKEMLARVMEWWRISEASLVWDERGKIWRAVKR